MIINGVKLIFSPKKAWGRCVSPRTRPGGWLIAAGLTAAVIPALAVVAGHLGAFMLGHVERDIAIQRAAIGLVATIGGGLVMAPALTLAIMSLSRNARNDVRSSRAAPAAVGILWPAWTAGVVLAAPPLAGLGPELGEILWLVLATVLILRVLKYAASPWLGVRRRWATRFLGQSTLVFALLFAAIPVAPAFAMRTMMGVESRPVYSAPIPTDLPLPPMPNW